MQGSAVLSDMVTDPHANHPHDPEKGSFSDGVGYTSPHLIGEKGRSGFLAPMWKVTDALEKQYGVEARGIERVPEEERHHVRLYDNFTLWMSANCTVSTLALGTLGNSIWFLGFRDAALTILFFNVFSTLIPAYFATFGKSLGIRALAFGRFSFGYWVVFIPTILNLIACLGWSVINSIAGGQALKAATTHNQIPMTAAIIVIAVMTLIVSFFGYKVVHMYERYVWIPVVVIFFILLGQSARFMETGPYGGTGEVEAASVLSFGGAIVGFSFGWISLAGDYTVNMPANASSTKLFFWTYFGMLLPMVLVELLGAALMTTFNQKTTWADAYTDGSVGGLIAAPLVGTMGGFGSFLMVLLGLSIVANNIPNIYSFAMTFQVLGPWAQAIPRWIISLFATILYTILACVGANSFESVLDNLLLFLAYWLAMYAAIIMEEHFIFRKGKWSNYDADNYNNWRELPLGAAAFGAIATGWIGAVMGMSTTFYVGKIGILFGLPPFGGDIGFELAMGFAGVTYPPLRYLEKKYWGK